MLKFIQIFIWIFVNNGLMMVNIYFNLTPKSNKWYINYTIPVLFLMYFFIGFYIDPFNTVIRFTGTVGVFLYAVFMFKEKILTKIFIYLITLIIAVGAEALIHVYSMLTNDVLVAPQDISIKGLSVLTIYNFLLFIAYSFFTYYHNKRHERVLQKSMFYFVLVPLSQFIIAESVCLKAFTDLKEYQKFVIQELLFVGFIVAAIADTLLFSAIRTNNRAHENQKKIAQLEHNQKMMLNYYQSIRDNADQLMKYKHDFNNQLNTVYQLIQSENVQNKAEGIKLLDEIRDKNKANIIPLYSDNPVINAVVYDKMNIAQKLNVTLVTDTKIPAQTGIELADLCSVVANLLDNAIKSSANSENKTVMLNIWQSVGYLFVRTINYPDKAEKLSINHKHLDSKITPDEHGYGMNILEDIVEKYDGRIDYDNRDDKDNAVYVICSMKMNGVN